MFVGVQGCPCPGQAAEVDPPVLPVELEPVVPDDPEEAPDELEPLELETRSLVRTMQEVSSNTDIAAKPERLVTGCTLRKDDLHSIPAQRALTARAGH